jgi:putative ABC transport system substrate-binding protein
MRVDLAALAILLCATFAAEAQPRIGVLNFTQTTEAVKKSVRDALREEGYVEGKNIFIEWRAAEGRDDRARQHAQELVRLKVDVIVAIATPAVQAAKDATTTIPIVMAPAGAPLRFVASLARPGGNITGVAGFGVDLSGKRIELLQQLLPGIKRIGLLTNTADPFSKPFIAESQAAAGKAGVELHIVDVRRPEEIDAAYAAMKRARVAAVIVQGVLTGPAWRAAELALQHRLPALSFFAHFADSGGLVNYTGNLAETHRRAASFVKRILGGANPAELPVERPTRTELVINLKTAKALGLSIPREVLLRADRLIE